MASYPPLDGIADLSYLDRQGSGNPESLKEELRVKAAEVVADGVVPSSVMIDRDFAELNAIVQGMVYLIRFIVGRDCSRTDVC